jgi:hypothetical protein
MILFNWAKIYEKSNGKVSRIIDIVKYLTYRPLAATKHDPAYSYSTIDWSGDSFLVNPELLFIYEKQYKLKEIAQYVGIAGLRNLNDFIVFGKRTLDLAHSPVGKDIINKNRLLSVVDDSIHFKWEEVTRR